MPMSRLPDLACFISRLFDVEQLRELALDHLAGGRERHHSDDFQPLGPFELADLALLEEALEASTRAGRRVGAVAVVHLYGQSADLDPIVEVCARYGVPLVEDAAESLGSTVGGRHTGTFGLLGTLSFNGNKTITTGGGGAITGAALRDGRSAAKAEPEIASAATVNASFFIVLVSKMSKLVNVRWRSNGLTPLRCMP